MVADDINIHAERESGCCHRAPRWKEGCVHREIEQEPRRLRKRTLMENTNDSYPIHLVWTPRRRCNAASENNCKSATSRLFSSCTDNHDKSQDIHGVSCPKIPGGDDTGSLALPAMFLPQQIKLTSEMSERNPHKYHVIIQKSLWPR
jgi:hypothetical protein